MQNLEKALVYLASIKRKLFWRDDAESIEMRGEILLIRKFIRAEIAKNTPKITNPCSKNFEPGKVYFINLKQSEAGHLTTPYVGDAVFLGDSNEKDCGRFKVLGWDDCLFPYDCIVK